MNGFSKIQPTHWERQAVVYLRQSSPKQVLQNRESAVNQRALRERLLDLGWRKDRIVLIDEDQGRSGKHASGRDGFQKLVADVSLRKVGIVMGYEVSRLSRNCADWHRLLELCGLFDTLIADSDGIYHPREFNDRLLLGLKGTMSEAELHSLHLRLDAGRLSKARRGELVHHLPTGYVRTPEGMVTLDPDGGVQARIQLVFRKFLELGTVHKVLFYLVRHGLKLPRRHAAGLYAGETLWKDPSSHALHSMLKNPAYAGAFAYGRRVTDPARQIPGRPTTGKIRKPRAEWIALVRDRYPAYITWDEYERIQQQIEENRQKMQDQMARKRAIRKGAALLTGLVRCAFCGRHMGVAYKERRFQYKCDKARSRYAKASCQYLSGHQIDAAVTQEFFNVLRPASIDALEQVTARQTEHHRELVEHLQKEVARLAYEAKRAERQYQCVDPENRLVAATLERHWENALAEQEQARACLIRAQEASPKPVAIPAKLREAFADVGRRLPALWPQLSLEARKSLTRTLVRGVNLLRRADGKVLVRIAWHGGLVSERIVRLRVFSLRHTDAERKVAEKVLQLADEGCNADQIAQRLNREGFAPCRGESFTPQIVIKLKRRYGIVLNLEKVRRGNLASGYTVRELARLITVHPSWIYRKIGQGQIELGRDPQYRCYLFPRQEASIDRMQQLKRGELHHVSFPRGHCNG